MHIFSYRIGLNICLISVIFNYISVYEKSYIPCTLHIYFKTFLNFCFHSSDDYYEYSHGISGESYDAYGKSFFFSFFCQYSFITM